MNFDYVCALACLCNSILSFDFGVFANKENVPSKEQQALMSVLISKIIQVIDLHFDMSFTKEICFLIVYEHHMHKIFSCLSL